MIRKLSTLVLVAGLVVLACFSFVVVGPDEIGVRADNVGTSGAKGIVAKDFEPGLHLGLPFFQHWSKLPARVRRVDMNETMKRQEPFVTDALAVTSADGDKVHVDLAILFQIQKGKAHDVVVDSGPGDVHVDVLKSLATDRLRASFGKLKTEDFYDAEKRKKAATDALADLQTALQPRYIDVVDVLLQDVTFDPKYDEKIREKKVADQTQEVTKSENARDQAKAAVALVKVDTENKKKLIATAAESESQALVSAAQIEAARVKGDADVYHSQKVAAGKTARALAEAHVNAAQTDALSGPGSGNFVARTAVENLHFESIILPTASEDFSLWLKLEEMVKRLGAK